MKKRTKVQTVLSLILIFAVIAFGVFAYLISQQDRTSRVKIIIPDTDVNIQLHGEAMWAQGDDKTFDTNLNSAGLKEDLWEFPNINFNEIQPDAQGDVKGILTFKIDNLKSNTDSMLNFEITGLKYDSNGRWTTKAMFQTDNAWHQESNITAQTPKYTFSIAGSQQSVLIQIEYTLLKENSSFNIPQNIEIKITQEIN